MRIAQCSLGLVALAVAGCGTASSNRPPARATPRGIPKVAYVTPPPAAPGALKTAVARAGTRPAKLPTVSTRLAPTPTPLPLKDFTATLTGTVSDAKDHSPISGALVVVGENRLVTKTNAFGHYTIHFPGGIAFPVQVSKQGYLSRLALGTIQPHQHLTYNFRLPRIVNGVPPAPPPPSIFGGH